MAERPLAALLGRDARYSGDLSFDGRVRVDGHFTGRIYSDDELEVGAGGKVQGLVDVLDLVVAGTVDGEVRVRGTLTLEPGGLLLGKVDAVALDARPGGRIDATLRVGTPQK